MAAEAEASASAADFRLGEDGCRGREPQLLPQTSPKMASEKMAAEAEPQLLTQISASERMAAEAEPQLLTQISASERMAAEAEPQLLPQTLACGE